jgi:hypothetical protein
MGLMKRIYIHNTYFSSKKINTKRNKNSETILTKRNLLTLDKYLKVKMEPDKNND